MKDTLEILAMRAARQEWNLYDGPGDRLRAAIDAFNRVMVAKVETSQPFNPPPQMNLL